MEFTEEQKQKILSERINIAKSQNLILQKLFSHISEDSFDTNIDLSEFKTSRLRDFSIYTSGFMSIQNFESMIENMSEKEIDSITDGKFVIKPIDNAGTKALAKASGITLPKGGVPQIIPLQTIQDGTYSIRKKQEINGTVSPAIVLNTEPVVIYTDNEQDFNFTKEDVLKNIRNLLVHSVPFLIDNKLVFYQKDFETAISKMWLRGYSEIFIKKMLNIDSENIKKELSLYFKDDQPMKTKEDVDKALSAVKNCFPEDIKQNYFRVNNFVKNRIDCYSDFFKMPLNKQISIIADICERNENYITSNYETISPSVVYNIQQLISRELANREDSYTYDDESDALITEFNNQVSKFKEYQNKIKSDLNNNAIPAKQKEKLLNSHKQISELLLNQIKVKFNKIKQRITLENAYMQFFNPDGLKNLPVEVATNIVCLMGYNNLVTSGLYEEISENVNTDRLSQNQIQYFNRFNFNGITLSQNKMKINKNFSSNEKCAMLTYIRNSICHGNIKFQLPSKKKDSEISFKDTILTFYSDWYDMQISGSLESFYKLFSCPAFLEENYRKAIYPKKQKLTDVPENSDENQSIKNN